MFQKLLQFSVGDDTPKKGELLIHVVEQYAVDWKKLGQYLGLADYKINNIAENNDNTHHKVQKSITDVLQLWIDNGVSPTWGKLNEAIMKIKKYTTSSRQWC